MLVSAPVLGKRLSLQLPLDDRSEPRVRALLDWQSIVCRNVDVETWRVLNLVEEHLVELFCPRHFCLSYAGRDVVPFLQEVSQVLRIVYWSNAHDVHESEDSCARLVDSVLRDNHVKDFATP